MTKLRRQASRVQSFWFPDCMVCMCEARTARFNCGHLVCCTDCANELVANNSGCPICRTKPICLDAYANLPPVPGRQLTYEGVEVAVQRLIKNLEDGTPSTQQEAAFGLCLRAQEEGRDFHRLVDAGVLPPLVALVDSGTDAAASCASVTLGLIASEQREFTNKMIAAGAVPALLKALKREAAEVHEALKRERSPTRSNGHLVPQATDEMHECAALALCGMIDVDPNATAAAMLSTDDGLQPLLSIVCNRNASAAALDAVCGVFSTLTENSGAEYDADAGIARAVHSAYAKEIADRFAACSMDGVDALKRIRSIALGKGSGLGIGLMPFEDEEARQEVCATAKRLIANVDRIRGGGVVAAAEPEAAQYTCHDNDVQVTALGRPVQRVRDRLGTRRGKGCSGCVVM